uniref:CSON013405 protein n=1 Tax=Culicoides sonorensis TaxID=179676 RepID=A0A336KPT4_CULSO
MDHLQIGHITGAGLFCAFSIVRLSVCHWALHLIIHPSVLSFELIRDWDSRMLDFLPTSMFCISCPVIFLLVSNEQILSVVDSPSIETKLGCVVTVFSSPVISILGDSS